MPAKDLVQINISNHLRKFRMSNGLTQSEMAQALGVVESTYRSWESRNSPKKDKMPQIAKALNISVDELINGKSYSFEIYSNNEFSDEKYLSELSNDEKVFILKYRQLNNYEKKELKKFLDKNNKK